MITVKTTRPNPSTWVLDRNGRKGTITWDPATHRYVLDDEAYPYRVTYPSLGAARRAFIDRPADDR